MADAQGPVLFIVLLENKGGGGFLLYVTDISVAPFHERFAVLSTWLQTILRSIPQTQGNNSLCPPVGC